MTISLFHAIDIDIDIDIDDNIDEDEDDDDDDDDDDNNNNTWDLTVNTPPYESSCCIYSLFSPTIQKFYSEREAPGTFANCIFLSAKWIAGI